MTSARPDADASPYVAEAASLARDYQLDYLEILLPDGSIVSSAQWPARFGYKEKFSATSAINQPSSRKRSSPTAPVQSDSLRCARFEGLIRRSMCFGGRRLDHGFLANLAYGVRYPGAALSCADARFRSTTTCELRRQSKAGTRYASHH